MLLVIPTALKARLDVPRTLLRGSSGGSAQSLRSTARLCSIMRLSWRMVRGAPPPLYDRSVIILASCMCSESAPSGRLCVRRGCVVGAGQLHVLEGRRKGCSSEVGGRRLRRYAHHLQACRHFLRSGLLLFRTWRLSCFIWRSGGQSGVDWPGPPLRPWHSRPQRQVRCDEEA